MRLLALTDIHGAYDTAEAILCATSPDILIVGGDLTTVGSVAEAREAVTRFRALTPVVLCVAGNMDLPAHDDLFDEMGVGLNARGVRIGDVGFCGASGAPHSRLRTPYEIDEEEIERRLRRGLASLAGCARIILVPHAPPFGTKLDIIHAGFHVGSTAVRDVVEECTPSAVVCGHIHEARGVDAIGTTTIVNCGPAMKGSYALLEIGAELDVTLHHLHD